MAKRFLLVMVLGVLSICSIGLAQEPPPLPADLEPEITLTTYYPAPYGDYKHLNVIGGKAANNTHGEDIIFEAEDGGDTNGPSTNGGNIILLPGAAAGGGVPGNVGIGTTLPAADLDVDAGSSTAQPVIRLSGSGNASNDEMASIEFYEDYWAGTVVNRIVGYRGGAGNYGHLGFETANSGTLYERMRIEENGSVGIGTTTPSRTVTGSTGSPNLDVARDIAKAGTAADYQTVFFGSNDAANPLGISMAFHADPTGANRYAWVDASEIGLVSRPLILQGVSNGAVGIGSGATLPASKLAVAGSVSVGTAYTATAAPNEGMIIEGNVGIGTTGPNTRLDVNGALSLRGRTAPAVAPADQGRIYFDSGADEFKVSENGGAYKSLGGGGFGNWSTPITRTGSTSQTDISPTQAGSDGFLVCIITVQSGASNCGAYCVGKTDSSAIPTTEVAACDAGEIQGYRRNSFTMPVKKNHYYSVEFVQSYATYSYTRTYRWIPIGS